MSENRLNVDKREVSTRGALNKLRLAGQIPGIVYGMDKPPIPIVLNEKEFISCIHTEHGSNVILSLVFPQEKKHQTVVIKGIQTEPIGGRIRHVDLFRVTLTQSIETRVHIHIAGESPGVKNSGGMMDHLIREVTVKCTVGNIPDSIKVDVSSMEIGDSVSIKDLVVPKDVKVMEDPEKLVLTVIPPRKEEEIVPETTEEAAPEVISKGKKLEEGEEEAKPSAPEKPQAEPKK